MPHRTTKIAGRVSIEVQPLLPAGAVLRGNIKPALPHRAICHELHGAATEPLRIKSQHDRFLSPGLARHEGQLIDLCNSMSLAFAIPVAVFDVARITEYIEVRYATGNERYATFSGETKHPDVHEVIFADHAGRAHARRWTNRQSGYSAVRNTTAAVLIVAEAMHAAASTDVQKLTATMADELNSIWSVASQATLLSQSFPRFEL